MSTSEGATPADSGWGQRLVRPAQVLIVSSVMFTFISYWRTAAVVLCDLASTAYYIGGIVENAIGPAAPWFILAVMLFSYAVRSVYLESCSLFVRGGVYRVVKEAMGGFLAKLSVSALMFDYILTGPTSGVSAGTYIMGLLLEIVHLTLPSTYQQLGLNVPENIAALKRWGAVLIALGITFYFLRQNLIGIHESSDKALKIMYATTVMAVIILVWCLVTIGVRLANGTPVNEVPLRPDLEKRYVVEPEPDPNEPGKMVDVTKPKENDALKEVNGGMVWIARHLGWDLSPDHQFFSTQDDPLGFLGRMGFNSLRHPPAWLSLIGILGLFIGFGHSILAMSGEETLAQVYREVESPKMVNFKKAAFIVFVYSLFLTAGISFLAVLLIPNDVRMAEFSDNLIGGLARNVYGPPVIKIFLEMFVVVIGFLILAGAVNTAIIGSNGVLNRVAEDGVLPDWFLKPHARFGTTYRVLWLITILQVCVILFSGGDMIILGEAYAFGVVWSFVFKALAMVVLRFKDHSPREFKVPLNFKVGGVELPVGLSLIFLVLLITALLNFFTKEVATVSGVVFTGIFLTLFMVTEHYHEKRLGGAHHQHREQVNVGRAEEVTPESLGLLKSYRKLVAIRSPQNLFMLEKALAETDPRTTGVVVMTAKLVPLGESAAAAAATALDPYDLDLMTAVVARAEHAGKEVKPLIVPTNNPLHAVLKTAKDLQANELIMGASNKYTADEQLEQIAFYWISLHDGQPAPITVRVLSRDRDMYLDLAGGNRIPKIGEKARTVAELRAAGVGMDRVLLAHDGTQTSSDLFQGVLTLLDPQVGLGIVSLAPAGEAANGASLLHQDQQRAAHLGRKLEMYTAEGHDGADIVRLARESQYDLIILGLPPEVPAGATLALDARTAYIVRHAHCQVFLAASPLIPHEVIDTR